MKSTVGVYVMAQRYETKPMEKEAGGKPHRKYIDVQYVHQGAELFGYSNLQDLKAGPMTKPKTPCLGGCIDGSQGLQVFGDMGYTF